MADENEKPESREEKGGGGMLGSLVQAESMVQLALALPAGCLVGWGLGTLADHFLHTSSGVIIGIVVGAIAGFVQIFTTASKYMKRGE